MYYDEEADYLEIRIREPGSNYGEEISEDITIFRDTKTDEAVGVGILNFKKKMNNLNQIELNLPFDVNFTTIQV